MGKIPKEAATTGASGPEATATADPAGRGAVKEGGMPNATTNSASDASPGDGSVPFSNTKTQSVHDQLGNYLTTYYSGLLSEPMPPRILELLNKLADKEKS